MNNHWIKINESTRIQEILDSYDFEKVINILAILYPEEKMPKSDLLKAFAKDLLERANREYNGSHTDVGKNGFWATKTTKGTYMLRFSIETWIQRRGDSYAISLNWTP